MKFQAIRVLIENTAVFRYVTPWCLVRVSTFQRTLFPAKTRQINSQGSWRWRRRYLRNVLMFPRQHGATTQRTIMHTVTTAHNLKYRNPSLRWMREIKVSLSHWLPVLQVSVCTNKSKINFSVPRTSYSNATSLLCLHHSERRVACVCEQHVFGAIYCGSRVGDVEPRPLPCWRCVCSHWTLQQAFNKTATNV
jgi:hypothetical protein